MESFVFVDLTAGDGRANPHSGTSSPEILCTHANWLRTRGIRTRVVLIEKNRAAYGALAATYGDGDDVVVVHGDARDFDLLPLTGGFDGGFVNVDPNSIMSLALTVAHLDAMPTLTTMFITLGCNAAGVRKNLHLPDVNIDAWRSKAMLAVRSMPAHHDAIVMAYERDAHRWGYISIGPSKWDKRTERVIDRSEQKFMRAWMRQQPEEFRRIMFDWLLYDLPATDDNQGESQMEFQWGA